MSAPDANKKSIIVAEDDALFAEIYAAKFAEQGYDVRVTRDGVSAWEMLGQERPDALLLDLMLPKMTGLELLAKLRASSDPALAGLPVIVVTNLDKRAFAGQLEAFKVQTYFLKAHVSFSEVLAAVDALVGR